MVRGVPTAHTQPTNVPHLTGPEPGPHKWSETDLQDLFTSPTATHAHRVRLSRTDAEAQRVGHRRGSGGGQEGIYRSSLDA
eukprot:5905683-Pyramimonas_sp.AAC.1